MKKFIFISFFFVFTSIVPDSLEFTGGKFNISPLRPNDISGQYYNELELYFYNKTDNPLYKNLHIYNYYRGKKAIFHTESERLSYIFQAKTKSNEIISNLYWGFSIYRSKLVVENYINPMFNAYQLTSFLLNQSSYYNAFVSSPELGKILIEDLHRSKRYKYLDQASLGISGRYINGTENIKFYLDLFIAMQGRNGVQLSYTDMLVLTLGIKIQIDKIGILFETAISYNEMLGPSIINGYNYESYLTHSFRLGGSLNY